MEAALEQLAYIRLFAVWRKKRGIGGQLFTRMQRAVYLFQHIGQHRPLCAEDHLLDVRRDPIVERIL